MDHQLASQSLSLGSIAEQIRRLHDLTKFLKPNPLLSHVQKMQDLASTLQMGSAVEMERLRRTMEPPPLVEIERLKRTMEPPSLVEIERLRRSMEPHISVVQQIERLRMATEPVAAHMRDLFEPFKMGRLVEDALRFQQQSSKWLDPGRTIFRDLLPTEASMGLKTLDSMRSLLALAKSMPRETDLDVDRISPEEVADAGRELKATVGVHKDGVTLETQLERILQAMKSMDSWKQKAIWDGLLPLVIGLILLWFQQNTASTVKHEISASLSVDVKAMFNLALATGIPQVVGDLGLIEKDLDVRMSPRRNSSRVGILHRGDVVTVIRRERRWSLVVLVDAKTLECTRGWVYSRYLRGL